MSETQNPLLLPPPHHHIALRWYASILTLLVLGIGGWIIYLQYPSVTCPKPKTIRYSYDDPRDYLGPFLAAVSSHDTAIIKRYFVRGASTADQQSILNAENTYRGNALSVGFWTNNTVASDITTSPSTATRLTWTTKKIDGCWRVQRVDVTQIKS